MGIAIPHGKSETVVKPSLAFAKVTSGVDWDSLDGESAKLVFMIAVPQDSYGDIHLKILQRLSRKLMNDGFRQQLLAAVTKAEIKNLLEQI